MTSNFIDIINSEQVPKEQALQKLIEGSIQVHPKTNQVTFIDGVFADAFIQYNDLVFSNGAFYTPDGMMSTGQVKKDISQSIYEVLPTNLSANTNKAFSSVREMSYEEGFDFADKMIIPFKNGDLNLSNKDKWQFFLDEKKPAPYRLPIEFVPFTHKTFTPNFDKWLDDLFEEDDILTLQEYLGYCLLPTTRGQKALLIIGDGGVGKSVLADILNALFGNAMLSPHDINDFFKDKFKLAELENKLLIYEDDLSEQMLSSTGVFKKLITNQSYITADRKGEQPFQFKPFSRFIMLGNDMLKSKYDISDGFFRRLLPLRTKPKPDDRENIPNFGKKIAKERDGIIQWALYGLKRLMDNNWQFTESVKTKVYMDQYKGIQNHYPDFLKDTIEFGAGYSFSTQDIKNYYEKWCNDMDIDPRSIRTLENWLSNNAEKLRLERTTNILVNGSRRRGYLGARIIKKHDTVATDNYSQKMISV